MQIQMSDRLTVRLRPRPGARPEGSPKPEVTASLRWTLETLWTDVAALSRNPLVEQLGLVDEGERDAYKRAMVLIDAVLDAGQRLKANGGGAAFALLDDAYGLEGERLQLYQLATASLSHDELAAQAGLTAEEHERELDAAVAQLWDALATVSGYAKRET